MTANPVHLAVNGSLVDVCDCLIDHNFRRVFITHEGRLAGVVIRALMKLKHHAARK